MLAMIHQQEIRSIIQRSIAVKQSMMDNCVGDIEACGTVLIEAYKTDNKVLFCGNGGSAADAQHIATELAIRFRGGVERRALPAMSLSVDPSMVSAGANDYGYENTAARMVEAFGRPGDVFVGISTSGKSPNVLRALEQAARQGMHCIGLLGGSGGTMIALCGHSVVVPSTVTAHIQECHITVGHIWCEMIEEALFPELFSSGA